MPGSVRACLICRSAIRFRMKKPAGEAPEIALDIAREFRLVFPYLSSSLELKYKPAGVPVPLLFLQVASFNLSMGELQVYTAASFYPEYKFLLVAEPDSHEGYRSKSWLNSGDDEIAAIRKALHKITRHRIPDAGDAEDLVQETLLTMLSRDPGEELKKGLLVWCQGILRNKVGNYYRKARRNASLKEKHTGPEQMPLFTRDRSTPEIKAWHKELRFIIEEKLLELPPDIRRVMELLVSGLEAGEIAELLYPEPYQNVMNRLFRGRKKLARELIKCGFGPNGADSGRGRGQGKNPARKTRKVSWPA